MGNLKKDAQKDLKSINSEFENLKTQLLTEIEMKSINLTNETIISLKNEISQSTEKEDLLKLKKEVNKLQKEPNQLEQNANEERSNSLKKNKYLAEKPYIKK